MDAVVEPYHWDDREKLYEDFLYLKDLHERLLKDLTSKLNNIHNVHYSERYWRILIGPWLGFFTQALFDRWSMVSKVLKNNNISSVKIISQSARVASDTNDFENLYITDEWNESIYAEIIMSIGDIQIEKIKVSNIKKSTGKMHRDIKNIILSLLDIISSVFGKKDQYFLIKSYIPRLYEIWLQIRLGQIPKFWHSRKFIVAIPASSKCRVRNHRPLGRLDSFEALAQYMILRHIPYAFLESYTDLLALSHAQNWPRNPNVIFTSNSYSGDDVFKIWAAERVEKLKSKLIIGQHGGNFLIGKWVFMEDHQLKICDKFLSWGKYTSCSKIIPFGVIKALKNITINKKSQGALLVELAVPQFGYQMYSTPIGPQWLDYFAEQCNFVKSLNLRIQNTLKVRLYHEDNSWNQVERWRENFPEIRFDNCKTLNSAIKKSKIVICTYNGATYLETLSQNIPTIFFWKPEHWELRDEAKAAFAFLERVGIFHKSPISAANFLNSIWADIDGWWSSAEVQNARLEFCAKYCFHDENSIDSLKNIFVRINNDI